MAGRRGRVLQSGFIIREKSIFKREKNVIQMESDLYFLLDCFFLE